MNKITEGFFLITEEEKLYHKTDYCILNNYEYWEFAE